MEFKAQTFEVTKDIFSVGKWNGKEYTEKDLESLEQNFNEMKEYKVPLKIDLFKNTKDEKERHGGMPAVGWVSELRKVGKKLFARITDIPQKVKELIENKAYRQVSIEMRKVMNGKEFKNILTGIALLGVEEPGVKNLDEFGSFYEFTEMSEGEELNFAYENIEHNNKGEKEMEEKVKELEAKLAEKEAEVKKFQAESEGKDKELASVKEKELKLKQEARESEVKKFIAEKKVEGKLLPKHEEMVSFIMLNSDEKVLKFKQGDKEVDVNVPKMLEDFINSMPNLVKFEELSQSGKNQDDFADYKFEEGKGKENDQKLDFVAKKIKEEKKISYTEALVLANKKYPDLVEK